MTSLGNSSTSGFNTWLAYGVNTNDIIAARVTMPEAGTINTLHAYFAGDGVSLPNCQLCLWDSGGNLLRQSSAFTQSSGLRSATGQSWASQSVSNYSASNGQVLYVGYYRDNSTWQVYGYNGSTGTHWYTSTSSSGPVALNISTSQTGTIGAYLDYTTVTGGIKTWSGSAWVKHPVKVWNGSSWVRHPLKSWDGSAWKWRG